MVSKSEEKRALPYKKFAIFIGAITLLLVILYFITPVRQHPIYVNYNIDGYSDIINNDVLIQPFSVDSRVSSISFRIGTLMERYKTGALHIRIVDPNTGDIVHSQTFDASTLEDNTFLSTDTINLDPGHYEIEFHVKDLDEGKSMVFYSTSRMNEKCRWNDQPRDYSIYLKINYESYRQEVVAVYRIAAASILAVIGICLIISHCLDKNTDTDKKKRAFITGIAFACLVFAVFILYDYYCRMIDEGTAFYFRNSRTVFYCVLLLFACYHYLVSKDKPWICWLLAALIAIVWIFTEIKYSVIDEYGHTEIVEYILANHFRFPDIKENYEAVQGPLSYYIMAVLTGWLPEGNRYFGGRVLGWFYLFLFGWITRKLLIELKKKEIIDVPDTLLNLLWLAFVINPLVLIRYTRVSNEALVGVFVAEAILLLTQVILEDDFDQKKLWLATVCCALAFLTKATAVFVFGLVFLACAYKNKWRLFFGQILLYILMLAPWFINNYRIYGAFTAIEGHLDFVLPIVNPQLEKPDLWEDLINYFGKYFLNAESGIWYDYMFLDDYIKALFLMLLFAAFLIAVGIFFAIAKKKFRYDYKHEEKKNVLFLSFTALPVVMLIMHAIQSAMTLNDSLENNRYGLLLNGIFCSMLLMGMSHLSDRWKRMISYFVCIFYSFSFVSMICGYTELVTNFWLGQ